MNISLCTRCNHFLYQTPCGYIWEEVDLLPKTPWSCGWLSLESSFYIWHFYLLGQGQFYYGCLVLDLIVWCRGEGIVPKVAIQTLLGPPTCHNLAYWKNRLCVGSTGQVVVQVSASVHLWNQPSIMIDWYFQCVFHVILREFHRLFDHSSNKVMFREDHVYGVVDSSDYWMILKI